MGSRGNRIVLLLAVSMMTFILGSIFHDVDTTGKVILLGVSTFMLGVGIWGMAARA